jgi:signal transduction histidine kinase
MPSHDNIAAFTSRLRHPRSTVRGRLTLLYGGLFLACGVALLAITYLLVEHTFPVVHQTSGLGAHKMAGTLPSTTKPPAHASPSAMAALISEYRSADLHHLLVDSSIALAIMVVASVALGWLIAGQVLRPLRTITATTRLITDQNLHQRLALQGANDELKDLGDTIDGLLSRLEGSFDAQRRFVANASHELRTPVTVGRTLLQMILGDPNATIESFRSTCEEVLETGVQQEQLIDALLTLARSQQGLDHRDTFDLGELVDEVTQTQYQHAADRAVTIEDALSAAPVSGDRRLVERLVTNLVENALRYNAPGGSVEVLVHVSAGHATLTVANTGPHIPADQVKRLLQPFQRLGVDRTAKSEGAGLGLSIVHAIAAAHNAVLKVEPQPTGGLHVTLRFPSPTTTNLNTSPLHRQASRRTPAGKSAPSTTP